MSRVSYRTYKDIHLVDERISMLKDKRDEIEYTIFNLHRDIEMICDEVEHLVAIRDNLSNEVGEKS